jgi:hypothetical protein
MNCLKPGARRLGALCVGVFAATALIGVTPAMATVTSSNITSVTTPDGFTANPPGGGLFSSWDAGASPSPTTTVSGTVTTDNDPASNTVDVRCYYGDAGDYNTIQSGVPVNPDGTFTTDPSDFSDETCRLAAVDSSYSNPLDPSTFRGPVYGVGYRYVDTLTGGPNDGAIYDFWSDAHQSKGYMEWESVGSCGLDWSQVFDGPFYDYDEYSPFNCTGAMYTGSSGDGYGRSEMQVDGRNAINSDGANNLYYYDGSTWHSGSDNANYPALSTSTQVDPATGNATITESEPLVFCGNNYPADAQCDPADPYKFTDTGVHFDRTIKQAKDGLQATVTDTYTSTDGAQHSIDMEYDNASYEDESIVYDVPGSSGFKTYYAGDTAELPSQAVGTVYVKDSYYGDGNPEYQIPGAFTYTTQPDRMFFNNGYGGYYGDFVLQYRRTVPAGGSVSITHVYTQAADMDHVKALAKQAENALQPPAVAIDSPANGSTTSSETTTVIGRASDDSGTPSLKVNGVPTPVQPDGTWSQQLKLSPGANTITAVASDSAGNTAQASETVSYSPAGSTNCQVPKLTGQTTAQAVASLSASNCGVGTQRAAYSSSVKAGKVISQGVSPGIIAANGTPVDFTVSRGVFPSARVANTKVRLRGNKLIVSVRCARTGSVTNGTIKLRKVSGGHHTLGTKAFQCPSGKARNVSFTFSSRTARAMHRAGRTSVNAYIVSRGSGGVAGSRRQRMTIVG